MPPQFLSLPRRSRGVLAAGAALAITATTLTLGAVAPAHADAAPPAGAAIPDTGYTLLDVDSESAPYPAPPSLDGTAKGAFDGDYSTQWASNYNGGTPDPMPHYLTFDIGAEHALTGLGYSVKVQGNGPAKDVQVLTTNDAAVAKDGKSSGWAPAGTATFSQPTSRTQIQYVTFAQPVSARYVEFKILDAVNGSNNASASEIVAYTTDPIIAPTPTPTPTPTPKPAAATVTTDSVDNSTWNYPDDTPASPFIDADGTFHFGESHANYYNEPDGSNGDIRQWNWYTGSNFDTAKPDDALNAAGTNPDTTDFCNAGPTGVESTKAPAGSSYTQPNY
ncbi:discoidin domain-containing protein, partial [Microbacterium sp. 13-71-7]|uniref:discoidin domain-containing protein n=1 Tax=Microbacterium sp. 13-71-7 TaxID=1970399 RepID=UPI000BC82C0E